MSWRQIGAVTRELDTDLADEILRIEDQAAAHARGLTQREAERAIAWALAGLFEVCPPALAQEICVCVLDHLAAGAPRASAHVEAARENARWWAATADAIELREHVAAGCRELVTRAELMPEGPRKALLVAIWESLPEADRRRFLGRVDPKGVFRGAA